MLVEAVILFVEAVRVLVEAVRVIVEAGEARRRDSVKTSCQLICSNWLSEEGGGGDGLFIVPDLKPKLSATRGIF